MAPETTIDFDAPHVPTSEVMFMFLLGFGALGFTYWFTKKSDPKSKNPVAIRDYVLPREVPFEEYAGYHSTEIEKRKQQRDLELGVLNT